MVSAPWNRGSRIYTLLNKYQLGPNEDKDSEWRGTAIYSRAELEMLISDARIPWDRRVLYALEGIAALRHGEAAGLRWRHYDPEEKPVGRLTVATSYNKGRTKTGKTRRMPVHPTLAAILAEWKLRGWPELMRRPPGPDDLVVPFPASPHIAAGTMRDKNSSYKRLCKDLEVLGLRHRRGHDLRRTMISLARTDGARKDILELCTHNPGKGSTIDLYTTFPWESLCAEVAKLDVKRAAPAAVIALTAARGGGGGIDRQRLPRVGTRLATGLATAAGRSEDCWGKKVESTTVRTKQLNWLIQLHSRHWWGPPQRSWCEDLHHEEPSDLKVLHRTPWPPGCAR